MAKTGGAGAGAGRKPGTLNRRTVEVLGKVMSEGISPIEYMMSIMRNEDADAKDRAWAAAQAAPFIHPRPAPAQRAISIKLPAIETAEQIPGAISLVLGAAARGEIAPGEAQSLVSIIEAQRKAIETGEIVRRLEALEAKNTKG
ncbi:hypothetical protein SAMN04487976_101156 [Xaviernesmea oryzae]|nr:hypothetical protein SAMN04487976_101156 [Xaviernesmea oryzae]